MDPRILQINLTGFLEKNTSLFVKVRFSCSGHGSKPYLPLPTALPQTGQQMDAFPVPPHIKHLTDCLVAEIGFELLARSSGSCCTAQTRTRVASPSRFWMRRRKSSGRRRRCRTPSMCDFTSCQHLMQPALGLIPCNLQSLSWKNQPKLSM